MAWNWVVQTLATFKQVDPSTLAASSRTVTICKQTCRRAERRLVQIFLPTLLKIDCHICFYLHSVLWRESARPRVEIFICGRAHLHPRSLCCLHLVIVLLDLLRSGLKFQIPPTCKIALFISNIVANLGVKVKERATGSNMNLRVWDSGVAWHHQLLILLPAKRWRIPT
ncbi:hypothetical protein L2E82_14299 [Cichorium intybus]|uniref:Uncharacterized protein n=1 Tax=Cichorium intybus TaxID=13427 RepID=A0ACB9F0V6_CICIN|nr:hypothetical protein L2E82_14299 [Cichorium intybus]